MTDRQAHLGTASRESAYKSDALQLTHPIEHTLPDNDDASAFRTWAVQIEVPTQKNGRQRKDSGARHRAV